MAMPRLMPGKFYEALIDQVLPDAMFMHDHDGRFVEVNGNACDSVGYTREELLRMSVTDLEQDFDLARAQQAWLQIGAGDKHMLRGHHRHKDGRVFPVDVHLGVIMIGDTRLYVAIARGRAERRIGPPPRALSLQSYLPQAECAIRAGRLEKRARAARMSRDIHARLKVIYGCTALVRLEYLTANQEYLLAALEASSRELGDSLDEVLDLTS